MKLRFLFSQTESNKDILTIFDGPNSQSTQIAKLSGYLGSFNISSTGGINWLFSSNDGVTEDGYLGNIHYGNSNLNIK